MHTLTLMRHAKSSWKDTSLSDLDRPLNGRGRRAAVAMAKRLRIAGYIPDLVIVSSALRTQQTAQALQKVYHGQLRLITEPILYEATPADYETVIRRVDEAVDHLMMIGHNPTMEWLASVLSGRDVTLPTAAYIRFKIANQWQHFSITPCVEMDYDFPKSR